MESDIEPHLKEAYEKIDKKVIFKLYPEYNCVLKVYTNYRNIHYIALFNIASKDEILNIPIKRLLKEIELNKRMSIDEARTYLNLGFEDCEFKIYLRDKEVLTELDKKRILELYSDHNLTYIYGPYIENNEIKMYYLYNRMFGHNHNFLRIPLLVIQKELELDRRLTEEESKEILKQFNKEVIVTNPNAKEELLALINTKKLIDLNPEFQGYKNLYISIESDKNIRLRCKINKQEIRKQLLLILLSQELNKKIKYLDLTVKENNIYDNIKRKVNNVLGCNYYSVEKADHKPWVLSNGKIVTVKDFKNQLYLINFKIIEMLYHNFRFTGNVFIEHGRPIIMLRNIINNGEIIRIQFSRAIVESKIKRRLSKDETVDHIDRDLMNNMYNNLQLLTISEHITIDVKRVIYDDVNCILCSKKFTPKLWHTDNSNINKNGPFCSVKCAAIHNGKVKKGEVKKNIIQPMDYKRSYNRINKINIINI